jgi:ribosomal protein S18 acetylase RimI-like enzyme
MTAAHTPATIEALVDALRDDPFYMAISDGFASDEARRREALRRYFDYSINEGYRLGRVVVLPDPSAGAAVWLLPAEASVYEAARKAKAAFLLEALGRTGVDAYKHIVDFMRPRASAVVDDAAWYLSIVGVAPSMQGQGIGRRLLEPTLVEADRAGAECYLETFGAATPRFYERLGFAVVATHVEPLTGATYTVMRRTARDRLERS